MAHMAKFKASASGHMMSHYDRSKQNISGSIDWERTPLNYNLAPDRNGMSQLDFLHQRLSEIKVQKRADVNVFCDWVVTLPKHEKEDENGEFKKLKYTDAEAKEFFKETYQFLEEKYGEKNVISAYVHMDETQPHMHFAFVPVVEDRKWNKKHPEAPREKLSAKECVTRLDLREFHTEFQERMDERFGADKFPVLNGATIGGNLTVAELRAIQATNEICGEMTVLQTDKTDLEIELKDTSRELQKATESLSAVTERISMLEEQKSSLEGDLGILRDDKSVLQKELEFLQEQKEELAEEVEILDKTVKKLDDNGAMQFTWGTWNATKEKAKEEVQKEKKLNLLERFLESHPQINQLFERWLHEERAREKSKNKHTWLK